ncbi:uncharacterized protein LOC113790259 isoform X2 [Dermatophagoides pteronyssinus]|uniref:uncharacterized protein LOC113790259 isoform X2 n=1 Tax=Dermatophagoides pteronyssinus TaxID=6956 RepID=UPI003F6806E0
MARRKKFNNGKTNIIENEQKSPKTCNNKAKSVSNVEPSSPNQNKQLLLKLLKFYNNLVRLMLMDRKELKQIQNDYKWFDNDLEKFYQKIINNFANGMVKSSSDKSLQKTWRNLKQSFLTTFNNNDLKTIKKLPPKNNENAKNLNINQQMESEQRSKMKRMLKRKLDDDDNLRTKTDEKSWATSTDRPRRSCTLKKPEQPSKIIIKSKSKNVSAKIPPIISISSDDSDDDSDDETSTDDSDSDTTTSTSSTSDSSSSSSSSDNDEENSKKNVEQLVVNCDPFNCMPSTSHNNNNHSNSNLNSNYQKSTLTNFLTILSPNTSLTTTTAAETNVTSSPNVLAMRIVDNQSNQQSSLPTSLINNNQRFNLMTSGQKLPPLLNQNLKTAFLLPSSSSLSKPNQSFTGKVLLLNSKPILVQNGNEIQLPMIANNLHTSLSTVPVKNFQQPNDKKSLSSSSSSLSTLNQSSTGKQPLQQPEIIKIEDDSDDDDNIEKPNKISKPNTASENCVQTKKPDIQQKQQPQQQNSNHESSSSLKKSSSTFGKEQILHSTPNPQNNGQLANVPMQLLQNHGLVRPNRPTPAILRSSAINKIISKSINPNPNLSSSSTPSSIVKQSNDPKIFHSHCQCDDWKTSKKAKKAEYMRRYRKNKKAQNQNSNSLVDQNILKNE